MSRAANPLTALAVVLAVDLALLISLDVPSALAAAVVELAPLAGLRARHVRRRVLPLAGAGALVAVTVALYGRASGAVLWHWGFVTVSAGSLQLAAATALRVLALGLPAVVLLSGLDPTRLGDALAQRLHLPARFVLAAVAATRLVGVLAEDRRTIALARRARGVGDGRLAAAGGEAFGVLVVALRRGTDLATAMEARGLGAPGPRTWSRPSRFERADLQVAAGGAAVIVAAVVAGLAAGTYRVALVG